MSVPAKKTYTEKELAFLDALFTPDVNGDIRKAMDIAGYSKNTRPNDVLKALRNEIIEASELMIATHAPKAAMAMIGALDNPTSLGVKVKMKAAQELLDRAGVMKKDNSINIRVPTGGIVLLPPKNSDMKDITPEEEYIIEHE